GSSAYWCQVGSGSFGPASSGSGAWQWVQVTGTMTMVCWTRLGGRRTREWPLCPGCPPGLRPVGFLLTGLGASGGLVEGAIEELDAFRRARSPRLRWWACISASCSFNSAIRASSFRQFGYVAPL